MKLLQLMLILSVSFLLFSCKSNSVPKNISGKYSGTLSYVHDSFDCDETDYEEPCDECKLELKADSTFVFKLSEEAGVLDLRSSHFKTNFSGKWERKTTYSILLNDKSGNKLKMRLMPDGTLRYHVLSLSGANCTTCYLILKKPTNR